MFRFDSHASDQLLLMDLEGELSPRAAASIRAHLEACWRCRARRLELEQSIAQFIDAYQQQFDGQLPPAAGPRALLKAELAQISESAANNPFRSRWALALSLSGLLLIGWAATRYRPRAADELSMSMPNRALTPGATILLSRGAVCSQANVKNKEVPASVQRTVFQEYGIAKAQPRAYEVDYLVTPALGGSDDIRNLWPHSYSSVWNARVKDALEDHLREMVCGGQLDLTDAQREIANDWIAAYKKYFHTDRPLP